MRCVCVCVVSMPCLYSFSNLKQHKTRARNNYINNYYIQCISSGVAAASVLYASSSNISDSRSTVA